MQKAILEKNEEYGLRIANFARAVYADNIYAGNIAFNFQAMKYYQGSIIIDKFIKYATLYFDSTLLKSSVAEVLLDDSLKKVEQMENASDERTETKAGIKKVIKTFSYSPKAQNFTNTLNEAAWFIYKNTNEKIYLTKALEWSSKGNQYFKKFEAMDTEARILFKLGDKNAAIQLMEKAITLKNEKIKSVTAFSGLDSVLVNMKENKIVIDTE